MPENIQIAKHFEHQIAKEEITYDLIIFMKVLYQENNPGNNPFGSWNQYEKKGRKKSKSLFLSLDK